MWPFPGANCTWAISEKNFSLRLLLLLLSLLLLYLHMAEGARDLSGISYKALIWFMRVPFLWLKYIPKALSPIPSVLAVKISTYEFAGGEGYINIQTIEISILKSNSNFFQCSFFHWLYILVSPFLLETSFLSFCLFPS